MITIFIPTPLRKFTVDNSTVSVAAANVAEAIKALVNLHPQLSPYIFDEQNNIRKHVRLYLGDDDIREREGEATLLNEGDELSIIPAIAGGTIEL